MSRRSAPSERSSSFYARSKAHGEKAVLAAVPNATILRPSIVFGPDDDFFNRFAALARMLPVLPLVGGGHTRFQPVFVGQCRRRRGQGGQGATTPGRAGSTSLGGGAEESSPSES